MGVLSTAASLGASVALLSGWPSLPAVPLSASSAPGSAANCWPLLSCSGAAPASMGTEGVAAISKRVAAALDCTAAGCEPSARPGPSELCWVPAELEASPSYADADPSLLVVPAQHYANGFWLQTVAYKVRAYALKSCMPSHAQKSSISPSASLSSFLQPCFQAMVLLVLNARQLGECVRLLNLDVCFMRTSSLRSPLWSAQFELGQTGSQCLALGR